MNYSVTIGSEILPVIVRKRRGARRFTIRYQPLAHAVSLTLPPTASLRQGLRFAQERCEWIERQIAKKPKHVPFSDGQIIPVLGKKYIIRHVGGRGVVKIDVSDQSAKDSENNLHSDICSLPSILVSGDAEFMARRVREWLKAQAGEEITKLAHDKAHQIGKRVKKISLRDNSSCWGSCSHSGNLSFSWRLILAPHEVLEYLVSHEAAHLKEHNHGPAFWAVVAQLFPPYKQAQHWLKRHGQGLYSYG